MRACASSSSRLGLFRDMGWLQLKQLPLSLRAALFVSFGFCIYGLLCAARDMVGNLGFSDTFVAILPHVFS